MVRIGQVWLVKYNLLLSDYVQSLATLLNQMQEPAPAGDWTNACILITDRSRGQAPTTTRNLSHSSGYSFCG